MKNKSNFGTKKTTETLRFLNKLTGPLTIASLLKSQRDLFEMSRENFAEKLGITASTLSNIESGKSLASLSQASKFAKNLGLLESLFVEVAFSDLLKKEGLRKQSSIKKREIIERIGEEINKQTIEFLESLCEKVTLGAAIRAVRVSEEMSQKELAQKICISPKQLSDIENGKKLVSPRKAFEIGENLGHSPKYFVNLLFEDMLKKANMDWDVSLKERKFK